VDQVVDLGLGQPDPDGETGADGGPDGGVHLGREPGPAFGIAPSA
jgi:hypothetical protein